MADCECIRFGRTTYEELGSYWTPLKNNESGVSNTLILWQTNNIRNLIIHCQIKLQWK